MNELLWYVAHTRPRREKKLVEYAQREGLFVTLPCYSSAHKYRGKTAIFEKPLFPGYVFFRLLPSARPKVYQSDYVANLLTVVDQALFEEQLGEILQAFSLKRQETVARVLGYLLDENKLEEDEAGRLRFRK